MKMLLIKPIQTLDNEYEFSQYFVDLGLGYLAAALRNSGHEVEILDFALDSDATFGSFRQAIAEHDFDCIGFKMYSMNVPSVQKSLTIVRQVKPDSIIMVGGPHPSAMGADILKELPLVDYAFRGEAELGLPLLLKHLEHPDTVRPEDIPGLIWRDAEHFKCNQPQFNDDLDALGPPAWDLLRIESIPKLGDVFGGIPYYLPLVTSRGCPYKCGYCGGHFLMGRKIRTHSATYVVDQMQYLLENHKIDTFSIVDDTFTTKRSHAKAVCEEIVRRNLPVHWDLATNGINMISLDAELIKLLEQAGCYMLSIAIESGTERILKKMRKPVRLDMVPGTIQLIREHSDILICSFFLIGYPTETKEDILRTVDLACSLDLDYVTFHIFSPLPRTEIAEELREMGQLTQDRYETYNAHTPVVPLEGLSLYELNKLYMEAMCRFFSRPLGPKFDKYPHMKASRLRWQQEARQYFKSGGLL